MQKSCVKVTVDFKNLKFLNTWKQIKKCERKFNNNKFSFSDETYLTAKKCSLEHFAGFAA